ncbi:bifunctional metallophosphatase/5'-nucleotidase [Embleya hyalina]|uniref:5'-nucleotidase n=1 Tax=Embleya hyalina TaxID=516124 RepID=A0A401YF34_9ACTN|nr:bifunctional metallophosphatase/5'-nucleotidase [Embleya hyalina]GCD93221.1 5'-nucleotidase [Embleya hyalina]
MRRPRALVLARIAAAAPAPTAELPAAPIAVQLPALNDLHGNLRPVDGPAGAITRRKPDGTLESVQAGGVPQLAALLDRARDGQSDTLTVGAGDMIGGSPLLSAAYHDEPTVDALDALGLDVTSVGNHEFDEGPAELLRMAHGGCHPEDGCSIPEHPYAGAHFPYLAGNVTYKGHDEPILPPYWITRLPSGPRIGFIGLTTRDTPQAVPAPYVRDLSFEDEVPRVDRYADELDRQGVKAIVVLVHEGSPPPGPAYDDDCDTKGPASELRGRIRSIAAQASPKVDLFVTGHSHEAYVCHVRGPAGRERLVTQAASFGRTYTDVRFTVDPATEDVVVDSARARNHVVDRAGPEDPEVGKVVADWEERSKALADKPVGYIAGDLLGRGSTRPETPLGDPVTDGQVEATRGDGAQLALLNPGGMRADLIYKASGNEGDGVVTYAEAFRVLPFHNGLITMTLTGDQLLEALRQQFSGINETETRVLQLSSALRYSVDMKRAGADRLLADTVRVDGKPVMAGDNFRVTVNSFLADGGNGFTVFAAGTDRSGETTDTASFAEYLQAYSTPTTPFAVPPADRVTFL